MPAEVGGHGSVLCPPPPWCVPQGPCCVGVNEGPVEPCGTSIVSGLLTLGLPPNLKQRDESEMSPTQHAVAYDTHIKHCVAH